eukprot:2309176-Amphidinium_carterae.1
MVKTLTTCRPKPSPPVVPQPVLLNNAWTRPGDGKGLPLYWSGLKRSREGWLLVEVRDSTVEALRSMLYVKHRNHLGHGKDAHKYPRKYNELVFHCAWRLEHEHLWGSFSASREAVGKRVGLLSQQGRDEGLANPPIALHCDCRVPMPAQIPQGLAIGIGNKSTSPKEQFPAVDLKDITVDLTW